ncbi:MAG: pitrilysin family protein [Planctomycetota bacterium]
MPITFQHHTLPNGLTILAETDPDAHTAAIGFFVKTGARDEDPAYMGVSHFLEHMMFKGTPRRSADDVNREFDEIGADYNAFTSHEQTVYYAHVLPEFLPRAADLLADMLRPSLRQDDFDMEKKVILEEIGMYDDRPEWRLQDKLLEEFFGSHPLGFRVLGTTDTVTALTPQQMRDYFDGRYSPDNLVVAAAGQVDFDQLCRDLEVRCGGWEATRAERQHGTTEPDGKRLVVDDPRISRTYLAFLAPGPSAQDGHRYAAKVLSDILGDADGSRLYWSLIDPGLADEADFSSMPQDHSGAFMGYATCDPARADEVEATLLQTIDAAVSKEPITADEVERAVNKLATLATLQGERPSGRMHGLGSRWLYHGAYRSLEQELAALQAVTPNDVASLLAAFPLSPKTILRQQPAS